eukprot:Hpha_TRINITY_DN16611_c5_g1::TRINITY_DN16611_c5_g1_i3::g.179656::m.179656
MLSRGGLPPPPDVGEVWRVEPLRALCWAWPDGVLAWAEFLESPDGATAAREGRAGWLQYNASWRDGDTRLAVVAAVARFAGGDPDAPGLGGVLAAHSLERRGGAAFLMPAARESVQRWIRACGVDADGEAAGPRVA